MTENDIAENDPARDRIKETTQERHLGVTVVKVARKGYDGNEHDFIKVYGKRSDQFRSLGGSGETEVERDVKIAEFPSAVATEILFGLAEAHGYELRGK